ncbi:MATE family efflux transporter [Ruminococcaceae bacterium OttesenSCG-928-L11]|nr:MATE family efflux transporter [Ruminococcaceae bacterium OttesenSCG-928-L11]
MELFVRDKEFYKKAARIALPVTAQGLITIGINLTDTVMLGVFGEAQLSASSLANQFYNIYQICCLGLGGGAAVLTAQFWGRKNMPAFRKTMTIMYRLCILLAIGFTVATVLFPRQIMSIYSGEQAIIDNGVRYFQYLAWSYLFQGLAMTSTSVMRSCHIVHISLISSLCSFLMNIFGNWVLMFGKFGLPRMEIAGAALSTLIARIFECLFIFGYIVVVDKRIGYRIRNLFEKCGDLFRDYMKYSMPVLVSDLLLALGNNAVAVVMGRIGSAFVSANAITMVVMQLSTIFNQGLSNASGVTIGNTLGAGEKEKAYRQGVTFFVLSFIVGIVAGLFILVLSPAIIGIYNITDETKAIATQMMSALAIIVVFRSNSMVMTKGVLRGGGDTRFLMIADILFLWVLSVPLGVLTGLVWKAPAFLTYTALNIDHIIKSFWCIKRLRSRKWMQVVQVGDSSESAELPKQETAS